MIVLIGCSGKFEEAIEKGDSLFDDSKFEEALLEYEIALEEKPDEEVKERVDQIHIYIYGSGSVGSRGRVDRGKGLRSLQEDEEAKHPKKEHKEQEDEMKKVAANIKKREKAAAEKKAKEEAERKAQVKQEFLAKFAEYDQFAENELLVHDYDSEAAYRQAIEIGANQWDSYMNEVYRTLKEDLSASGFASLKKEQQDWLDKLEAEMFDDAYSLENVGTAGKDAVLWIYYDQTRERCFHLVNEYLE